MKLKKCFGLVLALCVLSGCAELVEMNQKVADWAGEQIKKRDADKQEFSDTFTSKRDVDTLYTRVKREFGFKTLEDALNCNTRTNINCRWRETAITENGFLHEKTPGVYYKMRDSFTNPNSNQIPFILEVTLAKEGKSTLISYKTRGNEAFNNDVKQRLQKLIK